MASGVPKNRLIQAIINTIPESKIQFGFNIMQTTDVVTRLKDKRKDELESFLAAFPTGRKLLEELKERFPKNMPRTFFLVKSSPRKYTVELADLVSEIAKKDRTDAFFVNQKIRAIYVEDEGEIVGDWGLIEIPIAYERLLEFQIGDPPDSDRYGEFEQTYSLEHAYIWLLDDYSHGIICCTDYVALQAILKYSQWCLSLALAIPNMTMEIFSRLVAEGNPSSATFTGYPPGIPTVSVYAQNVDRSSLFQELEDDPDREQTAGFFRDAEGSFFASFGISRRYSRIWTPWRYSKPWLVGAAKSIIDKTEDELSTEYENNLLGYVSYFSNVLVTINDKALKGQARELFQRLLEMIIIAFNQGNETVVDAELLFKFVSNKSRLDLQISTQFDCPNCGGGLGRCPDCLLPYDVRTKDEAYLISCPGCNREVSLEKMPTCECGTEIEIVTLENHIQVYPGLSLQAAIENF